MYQLEKMKMKLDTVIIEWGNIKGWKNVDDIEHTGREITRGQPWAGKCDEQPAIYRIIVWIRTNQWGKGIELNTHRYNMDTEHKMYNKKCSHIYTQTMAKSVVLVYSARIQIDSHYFTTSLPNTFNLVSISSLAACSSSKNLSCSYLLFRTSTPSTRPRVLTTLRGRRK